MSVLLMVPVSGSASQVSAPDPGWSIVDKATLAVALFALAVSVLAAVIAWSQLRLGKTAAGGAGILFDVLKSPLQRVDNGIAMMDTRVRVELFGPNVRYQVAVHLEDGGRQLEPGDRGYVKLLPSRKAMSCNDDPIIWTLEHRAEDGMNLWCVLSWVEPNGTGIWTHAYARKLMDPTSLYEWRWYRTRRFRRWLQSLNLSIRPLGKWRPNRELHIENGHGPFDLRFAPDQRPRPRTGELSPYDN